jgi:hypothetical protein
MLSGEMKIYEVVEPLFLVLYMDTQECHIQVRCTGSIKTLIMLDSPENHHMKEYNSIVNQQFQDEEVDAQENW